MQKLLLQNIFIYKNLNKQQQIPNRLCECSEASRTRRVLRMIDVVTPPGIVKGEALDMLLIGRQGGCDNLSPEKLKYKNDLETNSSTLK